MTIAREEIFGPVLSIIPFDDEADGIAMANDTDYGLTDYLQTQDQARANRVGAALRAGMVEIKGGRLAGQGRPYIDVLDCGLGVDKNTADKIFEPFFTARSGGTGLGLYISRELCELNRATLLYLDRPGGGSIFRIVFADPDRWDTQDKQ